MPIFDEDELIYEVDKRTDLERFIALLVQCMEVRVGKMLDLKVPLPINICYGDSWGDLQRYGGIQAGDKSGQCLYLSEHNQQNRILPCEVQVQQEIDQNQDFLKHSSASQSSSSRLKSID